MNWIHLENETQLNEIVELSFQKKQAIFKHSTRCSISSVAKSRIDRAANIAIDFNYLDVISFRQLSNMVADKFDVQHESPQILLIKDGKCIFDESHNAISVEELEEVG